MEEIAFVNIVAEMNHWQYSFNKVSKAEWLRQMKMDLKEKPLESIQSEWWPGETLFPACHAEDREIEPIILPDHLFASPPRLIEWLDVSNQKAAEVNLKILEALQYGAESLVLNTNSDTQLSFDLWLKNVVQDIVEVSVQVQDVDSLPILKSTPDHIRIRIHRNENESSSLSEILSSSTALLKDNIRFIYNLTGTGDWINTATLNFQKLLDDWTFLKNSGANELSIVKSQKIQFEPDTDYLKQIIQTRVIHVIWQNLFNVNADSRHSKPRYLECYIRNNSKSSPEQFLINSATSSLAASLSGVHGLCIQNPGITVRPAYFNRNNRNIHHLLNMESEIYSGADPIGGAYAIDFYTRRWSEAIWKKLRR